MLRVELHAHSSADPHDVLDYSTRELIDAAAARRVDVLAVTLHGMVVAEEGLEEYAAERGVMLIRGIEKLVSGGEVLLYNVRPEDLPGRMSFDDLRALRASKGEELLVIAPHPYYPGRRVLGDLLDQNFDLFDAVEICHMSTAWFDPNQRAREKCSREGKTLVATNDIHRLKQVGRNLCEVDAEKGDLRSLFAAIRAGRVVNRTRHYSFVGLGDYWIWAVIHEFRKRVALRLGRRRSLT